MGEVRLERAPWALGSLHNGSFKERCQATVVDSVIANERQLAPQTVSREAPREQWFFTSKSGDVMRKRALSTAAFEDRCARLAETTGAGASAMFRYHDGRLRLLGPKAVAAVVTQWPPFGKEPNLCAVQAFVAGAVYRNSYSLSSPASLVSRGASGGGGRPRHREERRVLTATAVLPSYDAADAEGVLRVGGDPRRFPRSRAQRLNGTLDAATRSLVDFIERTRKVTVHEVDADYVVDAHNQLWLVWLGDAAVSDREPQMEAAAAATTTERRPHSQPADGVMDDDLLSRQVSAAAKRVETGELPSPTRTPTRAGGTPSAAVGTKPQPQRRQLQSGGGGGKGFFFSGGGGAAPEGSMSAASFADEEWPVTHAEGGSAAERLTKARFPTEFACAGDYCSVTVHDPKQLFTDKELASLSNPAADELRDLVRTQARAVMAHMTTRDQFATLARKSITLARAERRGLAQRSDDDDDGGGGDDVLLLGGGKKKESKKNGRPWEQYPVSPRESELLRLQKEFEEAAAEKARGNSTVADRQQDRHARSVDGVFAKTNASRNRDDWAQKRGALDGGSSSHYGAVRVCARCHGMYMLLDRARDLFQDHQGLFKGDADEEKKKKKMMMMNDDDDDDDPAEKLLLAASSSSTAPSKKKKKKVVMMTTPKRNVVVVDKGSASFAAAHGDAASLTSQLTSPSPSQHRAGAVATTTAAATNGASVTSGPVPMPRVTWRGRLAEAELYGESVPMQSLVDREALDARYSGLDDYLRGTSDAEARAAENKAAAVARSRAAQRTVAAEAGVHATELYFGRVLFVEKRMAPDLEDVIRTLEGAGYLVDVELDTLNARELVLQSAGETPGLWKWDAVLVGDCLDLGDPFDVVREVRGCERSFVEREVERCTDLAKERAARPRLGTHKASDQPRRQQHLPVIILAAGTRPEDLRAYRDAGMDGCVSRGSIHPIRPAALLSTLRAAVPRHGATLKQIARGGAAKGSTASVATTATRLGRHPSRGVSTFVDDAEAAVEFSLTFERGRFTTAKLHAEAAALLDELSVQLAVEPAALAVKVDSSADNKTKNNASRVLVRVQRCFPDQEAARRFANQIRARSQVIDEVRWGRHKVDLLGADSTAPPDKRSAAKAHPSGALGTSNKLSSSAMAAQSLALSASHTTTEGSVGGTLQLDADTSFPYCVVDFGAGGGAKQGETTMDAGRILPGAATTNNSNSKSTFNLVVCHDLFETYERMKIVLAPIAQRYPGLQVLLWNYPGQAFTEWRDDHTLSNVFLASCLNELMTHVGRAGTRQFDDAKPFFLLGVGYGASVCSWYATHYGGARAPAPHRPQRMVRGCVFFNGFSFVDPHLAGALHDALNVFSCAPPSRPDLPVYFWSRFLFSKAYLTRVSTPLALNLYTAVHNPLTLRGRTQLCTGALASHDVRPTLETLGLPIVAVHSSADVLVKPVHAHSWVNRGSENNEAAVSTIHGALKARKTCVVWVQAGHEVFQEQRKSVSVLIEQLVTGFHETNDVAFVPSEYGALDPPTKLNKQQQQQHQQPRRGGDDGDATAKGDRLISGHGNFEDSFIDNVLGKLRETNTKAQEDDDKWAAYQGQATALHKPTTTTTRIAPAALVAQATKKKGATPHHDAASAESYPKTLLDPANPAFERQDNVIYGAGGGSRIYPTALDYPEVKEYMSWRLKRNRKRLHRLDFAARVIQNAFRNFLAWSVVKRLRQQRASVYIQRSYRGWRGRRDFVQRMRRVWAAHVVQRFWRGCAGRGFFLLLKAMHAASAQIQRIGRGFCARRLVARLTTWRHEAAATVQALWRQRMAFYAAFALRRRVGAAVDVQRSFRGHLGRRRALQERHKFLFSKSQTAGIEFGRQMLLEHKLHATRLQSEVSLLTHEKLAAEENVEALLEEISEFEEGVAQLEKEMHQLSKIETEALGVLDEEAKVELREQKMRLDREFGVMLAKIAERRQGLGTLEGKLSTLDHARQAKEEELRALERKLVLLLEEQQRELAQIRRHQEAKAHLVQAAAASSASSGVNSNSNNGALALVVAGNDQGGPTQGYGGPSAKEKKQAAQLMQSTETLMKFGFMSMSMTYFSSLNMIRAMRTVSAQDTVMAALHANTQQQGGGAAAAQQPYDEKLGGDPFRAATKPGHAPGDSALKVSAWSVDDVARWLQTLSLGQYREAFIDAAVDGAFLYDLDDDDLRNTLGIEHRLHRKKILNMTNKLRAAEAERNTQLRLMLEAEVDPMRAAQASHLDSYSTSRPGGSSSSAGGDGASSFPDDGVGGPRAPTSAAAALNFDELFLLVRHGKTKKLKDALHVLPNKRFDGALVKLPYVEDFGTAYVDAYEREVFNLNKADEHANTMLVAAAQTGNVKIAKCLIDKGANPNHQNKAGQTAAHYANAYQFYDFLSWLLDPHGGGADDTVENVYGLGCYDGLAAEIADG